MMSTVDFLIQTPMFSTPISNHPTFPYKLAEQPTKSYIFLVIGKSDPLLRNLTNRNASALSWYKLRKFGISLRLHLPLDRSVNSFHLFRGFITHQIFLRILWLLHKILLLNFSDLATFFSFRHCGYSFSYYLIMLSSYHYIVLSPFPR